jgi:hypothetical protein
METSSVRSRLIVKIIRWIARVLSALVILIMLTFFVGDVLVPPSSASVPLSTADIAQLVLAATELIGLALAWKWEVVGGSITLVAFIIKAIINPRTVFFPLLMIPITAILFLLCWGLGRSLITSESNEAPPTNA